MKQKELKTKVVGYSKVNSKGQITIPKNLRKKFGIIPGIKILFQKRKSFIILEVVNKNFIKKNVGILGLKGKMIQSLMNDKQIEREL